MNSAIFYGLRVYLCASALLICIFLLFRSRVFSCTLPCIWSQGSCLWWGIHCMVIFCWRSFYIVWFVLYFFYRIWKVPTIVYFHASLLMVLIYFSIERLVFLNMVNLVMELTMRYTFIFLKFPSSYRFKTFGIKYLKWVFLFNFQLIDSIVVQYTCVFLACPLFYVILGFTCGYMCTC